MNIISLNICNSLDFGKSGKLGKGFGRTYKRSSLVPNNNKTRQYENELIKNVKNTFNSTKTNSTERELSSFETKFNLEIDKENSRKYKNLKKYSF